MARRGKNSYRENITIRSIRRRECSGRRDGSRDRDGHAWPEPQGGGRADRQSQPFTLTQLTDLGPALCLSVFLASLRLLAVLICRYHDHSMGLTAMNVYAGLAGPLLIRDQRERALQLSGVLPSGPYEVPLVLKDYWSDSHKGGDWRTASWIRCAPRPLTGSADRLLFELLTLCCCRDLCLLRWPCTDCALAAPGPLTVRCLRAGCSGFTRRPAAFGISCSASTKCSPTIPSSTDR